MNYLKLKKKIPRTNYNHLFRENVHLIRVFQIEHTPVGG